ncbi:probable ATP-dependent RNA helicase CG8611 [Copidosoma floridanum]|uniref:probable ATP-dependent RNA helicase CG8611 n=1 Tax=Copidosoma floridanum TaxID=29053 RepID=UPI0006C9BBC4|nr:probable ATP-dependent RNA helicase CG8611 [Copidosoma floridanum]
MAVMDDIDICLNIKGADESSKKSTTIKNSNVKIKRVKETGAVKKPFQKKQSIDSSKSLLVGAKKRIKQKNLAAIVAKQSANSSEQSILKKPTFNFNNLIKNKKANDNKKVSFSQSKDKESSEPLVKFTKPTAESIGQTILAKKRKVDGTEPKKSLSSIFKFGSSDKKLEADTKLLKPISHTDESNQKAVNTDKIFTFQSDAVHSEKTNNLGKKFKKLKDKIEKNKNVKKDFKAANSHSRPSNKISSLFGNNPEVPNIGQRLVKPVNEKVFTIEKFSELGIHAYAVSNLEQNMKITTMTTVQKKSIPVILSGEDVLIRSQTGSGKTLAYALPIIESLQAIRPKLTRDCGTKALVIVPTRELALQTYECFLKLIKPFTWIVPGYLIGGEKRKAEKARLRKGCIVLVATPGRLLDHIRHTKALRLDGIKYFVLDEADRMLDMGYEKDISQIVTALENIPSEFNNYGYDALKMLKEHVKSDSNSHIKYENKEDEEKADKSSQEDDTEDKFTNKRQDKNESYDALQMLRHHMKSDLKNEPQSERHDSSKERKSFSKKHYPDTESKQDVTKNKKLAKSKKDTSDEDNNGADSDSNSVTKSKLSTSESLDTPKNSAEETGDVNALKKRNTILLSATLTHAVEKLAGLTMKNPVFIDAAKDNIEATSGNMSEINEDLIVPQSVVQSYIVTPPKLRMVTLSAFIAGKCQSHGNHKIIVFMATQDMIDYHAEVLSGILTKPINEEDEDSDPLVDVEFHKLHGSMTQKERTEIFKAFRQAKSGVLLCTDVAARGLDLPRVDTVVQYTGPTSTRDYVHRIGRTARAGSSGSATIFLTPPEVQFVRMLEARRIRIKQEAMDDVLSKLLVPLSRHNSVQAAAIALQNDFENLVLENKKIYGMACKAYTSWVRFYSSYPREMREVFNRKDLHLGHYAKSFALRDPPQKIGGAGKAAQDKDEAPRHQNRLSNQRAEERAQSRSPGQQQKHQQDKRNGMLKKVLMLNTSEYDSGLEPVNKKKRIHT